MLGAAAGKSAVEDYSSDDPRYDLILGWRPFRHLALEASYIKPRPAR
ncbi:MAG: hypothetical protein MZV65_13355 [Chromatiales bacterium]|nr:hypothetical protein [Chromatiales bacterium]